MVNMKKIEDEAKIIVAETESVLSQIIGFASPRWDKFAATWKTLSYQKKIVAVCVFSLVGLGVYEFVPSPLSLLGRAGNSVASYIPSRTKITPVTQSDLADLRVAMVKAVAADTVSREDFYLLQDRVNKLEKPAVTIESKPLVTGSVRHKKKAVDSE